MQFKDLQNFILLDTIVGKSNSYYYMTSQNIL